MKKMGRALLEVGRLLQKATGKRWAYQKGELIEKYDGIVLQEGNHMSFK